MNFKRFSSTRKKIMAFSIIGCIIIVAAGAIPSIFLGWLLGGIFFFLAVVLLVLFANLCIFPLMKTYKKIIIEETLHTYIDELEFSKSRFTKEFIKENPIIPLGKDYVTDYYFLANYKGINFELGTVISFNEIKTNKVYIKDYDFCGKLLSIPIETDEKASLFIAERKKHNDSQLSRMKNTPYQYLIKTGNDNFDEYFEFFSTQPNTDISSFVKLLIETLRKVKKMCALRMFVLLSNNRLYFAIDEQKASFEPNLKTPVNENDIHELRKEYHPFFQFMDALLESAKKTN